MLLKDVLRNKALLLQESMQKVLREFGFDKNQTENCECPTPECPTPECPTPAPLQDCPLGWFRIRNSCIWVSPSDMRLNVENAKLHCITKLSNARLFEPRTQMLNYLVPEFITILDGSHLNYYLWLGMNDKGRETQYVYNSSEEPIGFTNWVDGQPDGHTGQNCVVFDYRNKESKAKWRDVECRMAYRFICEKILN